MIKAVIFDLNGVFLQSEWLSDRMERHYRISSEVFVPVLKNVMEVVRKPDAPSSYSLWKPYFDKWGLNLSEKEFFDFWFGGERLVSELIDYVQELRRSGLEVYILSNNFRERTEYYRENFPELFKFDGELFSWETGFVKPQKEAYLNVLEISGVQPEECLYFDDSEKNIEVAREIGIKSEIYQGLAETKRVIEGQTSVIKERHIS